MPLRTSVAKYLAPQSGAVMNTDSGPRRFQPDNEPISWASLPTSVKASGEAALVVLQGELDVATAPRLRHLLGAISATTTHITLDLGALEFMDAAGLGVMVETNNALNRKGGRLQVNNPSPLCEKVLGITGLDLLLRPTDESLHAIGDPLVADLAESRSLPSP